MFCLTVNVLMTILSGLAILASQKINYFFCEGYILLTRPFYFLILELPLDI